MVAHEVDVFLLMLVIIKAVIQASVRAGELHVIPDVCICPGEVRTQRLRQGTPREARVTRDDVGQSRRGERLFFGREGIEKRA
jgi:hypothetical protein